MSYEIWGKKGFFGGDENRATWTKDRDDIDISDYIAHDHMINIYSSHVLNVGSFLRPQLLKY